MRIFDRKGMLIIPTPEKKVVNHNGNGNGKKILIEECFCQNGHNLISNQVMFKGYEGILLKVASRGQEGYLGISPLFRDESHISMGIELISGEIVPHYMCPVCEVDLPVFSVCKCGAGIFTLFLNDQANYSECLGICSRFDCFNSTLISKGELLSPAMMNSSEQKSGLGAYQFPH